MQKYNYESGRQDYQTPVEILDIIFQELNLIGQYQERFDCDVCCNCANIPAKHHFIDGITDGLQADWYNLNYCNPPFRDCGKWVAKAYKEFIKGKTTVMLIPARTETKYWQDYILTDGYVDTDYINVKFLKKGYQFINPIDKSQMGVFKNALAIVIFDGVGLHNEVKKVA